MTSYAIVPVICLAIYVFLLFSFVASKKDALIKSYMHVLVAMILWTGGSFLMRVQMYPSMKFWYDISILGILSCIFTLFSFVQVYINKKYSLSCYVWAAINFIVFVINTATGWFLAAPKLIGDKFIYHIDAKSYILLGVALLCAIDLVVRVLQAIKTNKDLIGELKPLFVGILAMLVGHILYFLPVFEGFPIDILSGIAMAVCMYYMVYQRRLFKLTLLVSKINIQIISVLCTIFIFVFSLNPIQRFIDSYLGVDNEYNSFIFALMFMFVVFVLFKFFSNFIDKVFIKNEMKQNEVLNEYSLEVNKSLNIDDVLDLTIEKLKSVIDVNDVVIALLDEEAEEYVLHGDKKYFAYPNINKRSQLFEYLKTVNGCVTYSDFQRTMFYRSLWQSDKDYFEHLNVELMLPLKENNLMGVIFMAKKNKGNYKYDEMIFLSSLSSIATIAIKNSKLYHKVYMEATHDDLTGLYNRKHFYDLLNQEYNRYQNSLTLIDISIDDFRLYNQLYGQSLGDEALVKIAAIIKASSPRNAYVARNQGKEFTILLPEYNVLQAKNLAEDIRLQVLNVNSNSSINAKVITVSIGIASIPVSASNVKQLIESAEYATYVSKKQGKNCTTIYNVDTIQHEDTENQSITSVYNEYSNTIYALQAAIDTKDHYTFNHSNNVAYYATTLAKNYGLSDEIVEVIRESALLHDIGKIGIPEHILNKHGRLTNEEFEVMKGHVDNSIGIIKHLPSLDYVIPAVVSHHERWDGRGYPRKISGNDIPLTGRILCIADCFDAMTSKRTYKEAYSVEDAIAEIDRQAGKQFDPELAALFIKLVKENIIVCQEKKEA